MTPRRVRFTETVLDFATDRRIREVPQVPGEKVIHTIHGRDRNVDCVETRLNRQCPDSEECVCEGSRAPIDGQDWQAGQRVQPAGRRDGVTTTCLSQDRSRDVEIETVAARPPFARRLLMRRLNNVAGRRSD